MTRASVICVTHGGGPLPVMGDPAHKDIVSSFQERVPPILRLGTSEAPKAIVVVTAHWSTSTPTISSASKHQLYYDYGGFPPAAYRLKYDAPGSPEVAQRVFEVLKTAGLNPAMDDRRGWDHGVFIPMMVIHPEATVPIVQLSVLNSEDAGNHLRMGHALSKLRDENIAIMGSGSASFHNLRLMFSGILSDSNFRRRHEAWSQAMVNCVTKRDFAERDSELQAWRGWPHSFEMHPKRGSEHFLPLLVCAGAGGEEEVQTYSDEFVGLNMQSFYWNA